MGELTVWTPDEVRQALDYVIERDESMHVLLAVTVATGMRRGEVLGLRWNDTDLDAGQIRVQQTLIASGHRVSFGDRRPVEVDARLLSMGRPWHSFAATRRARLKGDSLGESLAETGIRV